MTPTRLFLRLTAIRRRADSNYRMLQHWQDMMVAEMEAAYRAENPKKRKFKLAKIREDEELEARLFAPILAKWRARAAAVLERRKSLVLRLDEWISQVAEQVPVRTGGMPVLYDTTYQSTFSTQTDSEGYARRSAEMRVQHLAAFGVPARVELVWEGKLRKRSTNSRLYRHRDGWGRYGVRFEVWAEASPISLRAIKERRGSLRSWLKSCLRNGINPRVLNPFLPHGLEERLGLDWHGNDVERRVA